MESKPRRTHKACDTCRLRKLKCDGDQPCRRCQSTSATCQYSHVERRRKPQQNDKVTKPFATMQNLETRLGKLEGLIGSLVQKLSPELASQTNGDDLGAFDDSTNKKSRETSSSYSTDTSDNEKTAVCCVIGPNKPDSQGDSPASFFGNQSSLSILGPRGLQWLAKRASDPQIWNKFTSLNAKLFSYFQTNITKWTDGLDRSKFTSVTELPPRDIVQPLVDIFLQQYPYSNWFLSEEEINDILTTYYEFQESLRKNEPAKRKRPIKSDFLIINSLIGLGAVFSIENSNLPVNDPKQVYLRQLRDHHIDLAIYYYHRLSLISEGIKTVQGILLLILHTDISPAPQVNYMLITTAVRYAQELGLHRANSYPGLTEVGKRRRKSIWIAVYLFDSDLCLKSGKPPIVNDSDMANFGNHSFLKFSVDIFNQNTMKLLTDPNFDVTDPVFRDRIQALNTWEGNVNYLRVILSGFKNEFTGFAAGAYGKLFSSNALNGKSANQILQVINDLNIEIEEIRKKVPASIRPGNPLDPRILDIPERYDILLVHFQYHLDVMLINRMAFKRLWVNDDLKSLNDHSSASPIQNNFMEICLGSARSILRLMSTLEKFQPLFFHFVSFFYFSAFFTLLTSSLEVAGSTNARDDLILLQRSSDFFLQNLHNYSSKYGDNSTANVVSLFAKFFLKIAISVHNMNLSSENEKLDTTWLQNELISLEKIMDVPSFTDKLTADINGGSALLGNDGLSHSRDGSMAFDPVRQSLSGNLGLGQYPPQSHSASPSYMSDGKTPNGMPVHKRESVGSHVLGTKMPSFDFNSLDDIQFDNSSGNLIQQLFSIPNIYLNTDDLSPFDNLDNGNFGF